MGFYPRIKTRRRQKEQKPVLVDIDKLAKREDVEAIAKRLQDAEVKRRLRIIAHLSPRQKRKLAKILAERKGKGNEKKG